MERLSCWEYILGDDELASLVGKGHAEKGKSMLLAMKQARALDQISQDGRISEAEFKRIYDSEVLAAAAQHIVHEDDPLRKKVDAMWDSAEKDEDGEMERLSCWEYILGDDELASLVGKGHAEKGKSMLLAMKQARALDQISQDGRIS